MFTPLESFIRLLSNGLTNSIVSFFDIRLISLEHVTYQYPRNSLLNWTVAVCIFSKLQFFCNASCVYFDVSLIIITIM